VLRGKPELLTNFNFIFKMFIPTVDILQFKVCYSFSFAIVEIQPANKDQNFFLPRHALSAHKTSFTLSFTILNY
jgi:hypothetical protein